MKGAVNRSVLMGGIILGVILLIGLSAPFLGTRDPSQIDPISRNKRPGAVRVFTGADGRQTSTTYWMGTDSLGRDVYSRVLYGARVSLLVGVSVALISVAVGLVIGLLAGYLRWLDGFVMRIMDGLMAVPAILLAIALVSLSAAGRVDPLFEGMTHTHKALQWHSVRVAEPPEGAHFLPGGPRPAAPVHPD